MIKKSFIALLLTLSLKLSGGELFYQHGQNAVLINNTKGEYILTISDLDNETLKFTNGIKKIDKLSCEKFFQTWTKTSGARGVVINLTNHKNLSFTLKEPKYNMVKKTVEFKVDPVSTVGVKEVGTNWGEIVLLVDKD